MGIRITGVSTPIGGISWEFTETKKKGIKDLFLFLESKRILVNPKEMEVKEWSEQSVIEIKNKLVSIATEYEYSQNTMECFKMMIDTCNIFLDNMHQVNISGIIYKNQKGDWIHSGYASAMKEFRKSFKYNIQRLLEEYQLTFSKEIPEEY